ncbi:Hypothetical predicted protein [Marmota monax]|uniref:Peptidase M20 dimerisation domain-containing protein n=1 Tax=Marmota monax TaxID=9995 RepID=A0A5E4A3D1_MARMO|nr:Hypothetical predicted protein [Marmota monax]
MQEKVRFKIHHHPSTTIHPPPSIHRFKIPGNPGLDNSLPRALERSKAQKQHASCLLALLLLLLLEGGMFPPPPSGLLGELCQRIDLHQDEFVQEYKPAESLLGSSEPQRGFQRWRTPQHLLRLQTLKEWVAVESDSIQPVLHFRQELFRMMAMAAGKRGIRDLGSRQLLGGQSLPIPPIILAELGNDPKKPTVCLYGHLDVRPAQESEGWLTDPYTPTEVDGKLYGRGSVDNKDPVLAWIHAVSAFRDLEQDLPVNFKFILEGMEEAGSVALEELIKKEMDRFFSSVDYIVISDNLWLSQTKPALTYGTRGNSYCRSPAAAK